MLQWDQRFLDKVRKLGIQLDMYHRYVDDMTIITRLIARGWRYQILVRGGKLIFVLTRGFGWPTASLLLAPPY